MTAEKVEYDAEDRWRIVTCPYCGDELETGSGMSLVAHLPCDEVPSTEEVVEATS